MSAAAEAIYRYENAAGAVVLEAHRLPGKKFMQRDPRKAAGEWGLLPDTARPVYRLPRVREHLAANRAEPLFVVEGEKDVHALEGLGFTATCNPMGAGKWTDEHSEQLAGARNVAILADDDEPGRAHAQSVAASLGRVGVAAKVIELWPKGGSSHHDVSDWLKFARDDVQREQARKLLLQIVAEVPAWRDETAASSAPSELASPFQGRLHRDVLALDFPSERELIRGLIPAGAVGTIAGVPETFKSWQAARIAVAVAQGEGTVLGREVVARGPVGYFWQDDSEREEAERVKHLTRVWGTSPTLPLHWFLNVGAELPGDLPRLRMTIEELGLVLVVLDSFYNFLPGLDLKDDGAEQVVAQLKREVADATGCSVLIVDHMPWATEQNRKRLRAYGGVFKNAATRFGIYIDAAGSKLWVEARGNNIAGIPRSPAYWDADALELRLVQAANHDEKVEERAEQILAVLEAAPADHSKTALRKAVGGRAEITDQALTVLIERDRVQDLSRQSWTAPDGTTKTKGYIARSHAATQPPETLSHHNGTAPDSPVPTTTTCPPVPSPIGGQGDVGTGPAA